MNSFVLFPVAFETILPDQKKQTDTHQKASHFNINIVTRYHDTKFVLKYSEVANCKRTGQYTS